MTCLPVLRWNEVSATNGRVGSLAAAPLRRQRGRNTPHSGHHNAIVAQGSCLRPLGTAIRAIAQSKAIAPKLTHIASFRFAFLCRRFCARFGEKLRQVYAATACALSN